MIQTRPTSPRRRSALLALVMLPLPAAVAQAPPAETYTGGPVLVIEHTGLRSFFVDPKDQPFARALGMLPDRIRELPAEIEDMPPEAVTAIQMALWAIDRPGRLTVAYDESPTGGLFGYGVALSVRTETEAEAQRMHGQLAAMLDKAHNIPSRKPSSRFQGMLDMQLPVGILSFGPRQGADGWRYEIIAGTMPDPDVGAASLPPAAAGLRPVLRASFDFAGLTPAIDTAQMFAGATPQWLEVREHLQDLRLIGPGAMRISVQTGHTENETVTFAAVRGAGKLMDALGISRAPLEAADLRAIPADAVYASMSRMGFKWLDSLLHLAEENSEEAAEAVEQFREATGVDLHEDVLGSLGDLTGFYMSEAAGGSGLGSSVLMISVSNRERLGAALNRLAGAANELGRGEARGYVRISPGPAIDGVSTLSLRFPGIPVPLELTASLTDRWLLLTATPQAAIVASAQAMGRGDGGLPANAAYGEVMPKGTKAASITFINMPSNLGQGYTALSMIGSALANLVRSPADTERDPGMLVPTFPDLRRGARAHVFFAYWEGEDYLMEMHGDRSVLVNAAGVLGSMTQWMPMYLLPALAESERRHDHRELHRHMPPPPPPPDEPDDDEEGEEPISMRDAGIEMAGAGR